MKNSHFLPSPHHSPSFLSDSPLNPEPPPETFEAPPNDQLKTIQDLYDGLLHYVSCTADDIVEIANQIQENCSTAKSLLENLKDEGLLDRKIDPEKSDFLKVFIKERSEKSPLGKRPNPYLDELDKETLIQANVDIENLEPEPIIEEESQENISNYDSENNSAETEDYDGDTSEITDKLPKSYEDKQTQTCPVIPSQQNFQRPPQYFPSFTLPSHYLPTNFNLSPNAVQDQNENDNNDQGTQKLEISPPTIQQRPLILVQPVYLVQPVQIINYLPAIATSVNEPTNEMKESDQ